MVISRGMCQIYIDSATYSCFFKKNQFSISRVAQLLRTLPRTNAKAIEAQNLLLLQVCCLRFFQSLHQHKTRPQKRIAVFLPQFRLGGIESLVYRFFTL